MNRLFSTKHSLFPLTLVLNLNRTSFVFSAALSQKQCCQSNSIENPDIKSDILFSFFLPRVYLLLSPRPVPQCCERLWLKLEALERCLLSTADRQQYFCPDDVLSKVYRCITLYTDRAEEW